MGFLERLSGVLQNNNKAASQNANTSRPYYEIGFNRQALSKYGLKQDTLALSNQGNYTTPAIQTQDNLAIIQPVRFIKNYLNENTIKNAMDKNPNIQRLLEENGLKAVYDLESVKSIIMSHLIPTAKTAQKIYTKMGHKTTEENYLYLTQAALLHDIGKCFIPKEILNKKGKLTNKERLIIELHNRLSYEILKTTDLNPKVAQLAFEHHDYDKKLKRSHENQALTIADVYCALKENRTYKKPLSDICAKTILYDMGTKGNFDTKYINYACVQ